MIFRTNNSPKGGDDTNSLNSRGFSLFRCLSLLSCSERVIEETKYIPKKSGLSPASEVCYLLFQRQCIHVALPPQTRIIFVLFAWISVSRHLKLCERNYMELVKLMSLLLVCTVFQSDSMDNACIILSKNTTSFRYLMSSETTLSLSSHIGGVNCDA